MSFPGHCAPRALPLLHSGSFLYPEANLSVPCVEHSVLVKGQWWPFQGCRAAILHPQPQARKKPPRREGQVYLLEALDLERYWGSRNHFSFTTLDTEIFKDILIVV